jgi:transcriptional regulator with XRE-family HTH domain
MIREDAGLTQRELAKNLRWQPSKVAKTETGSRRIDPVEMVDWCRACKTPAIKAIEKI